MITGKAIALTWQTSVGKVMSLFFNILSRFVIAFLPRSKCLLISWLQSPSAVILEPKKIKYVTVSIVSPSICHEVMGPDAMILVLWMLSFKPCNEKPTPKPSNKDSVQPKKKSATGLGAKNAFGPHATGNGAILPSSCASADSLLCHPPDCLTLQWRSKALAMHKSCRSPTEKLSPFSITSDSSFRGSWAI